MASFQRGADKIRLCGGTCGRKTRPTSVLKKAAPDTVTRINGTHCGPCWAAVSGKDRPVKAPDPAEVAAEKERKRQAGYDAAFKAEEIFARQRRERIAKRQRRVPV